MWVKISLVKKESDKKIFDRTETNLEQDTTPGPVTVTDNFLCKKIDASFVPIRLLTFFFFSQIELYHEIFDRTEKKFDLNGQICPDL